MRFKIIAATAMALAFGASAHAAEFVQNGGFETLTSAAPAGQSFEFGASYIFGNAVADWQSNSTNAFNLLFLNADPVNASTRFSENGQYLWSAPGPLTGNFVALDGDSNYNGPLTQMISGLTAGATYTLTFDWAAAQYADRTGPTTEQLVATIGGDSFSTAVKNNASQSSTGWFDESFTFKASGSNELLSFLSIGTPNGMPPVALLDNVSITGGVPEPATWGMMLVGVAGVGAIMRRRRALVAAAA